MRGGGVYDWAWGVGEGRIRVGRQHGDSDGIGGIGVAFSMYLCVQAVSMIGASGNISTRTFQTYYLKLELKGLSIPSPLRNLVFNTNPR